MPKAKLAMGLVVLCAAAILAAPSFAFDDIFQHTYTLPSGGTFELQNVNGAVTVSAWNRDAVEVYAKKSARRNARDLDRVEISVDTRADRISVQTRYPHDEGVEVEVEYHIRVPQRVRLSHVGTVNGTVRVFGVDGRGELRSVNGDVEVFDSAGALAAHTTNGNLRMELRRVDGASPISLETVNGTVVLALPPDAAAEFDVRSLNGDFRSELSVSLQGAYSPREFRGRLGAGGTTIKIRTVNGGIRVVAMRPVV